MRGTYRFYDDEGLVAKSTNLITDAGRLAILRYLAGRSSWFAGAMVFGVGSTPASVSDIALSFQFESAAVDLGEYDDVAMNIVIRAAIPDHVIGEIHEVGLRANGPDADLDVPSEIFTRFDHLEEDYTGGQVFTDRGRLGQTSLGTVLPSGGTEAILITIENLDLSEYSGTDAFALAYDYFDGTVSSVEVRFVDEIGDARTYSFAPELGYGVHQFTKNDLSATGSPSWDSFVAVEVIVTGNEGGSIAFDGLRVDVEVDEEGFELVSRSVLPEPIMKDAGAELQVEYAIDINI